MEESQELKREQELAKYSHAGLLELANLENGIHDAEKAVQERPDDEIAAMRLENARKRLELFEAEHDNAGAFKFKKFGRKMQELFEPGPDGKAAIEAGEDGELKLAESMKDRRFMLVNMGELDRFNKEGGGHAAGDAALGKTASAVEAAVVGALGNGPDGTLKSDYQIYRYDGNTFMVDIASMPLKEFGELIAKMQEAEPRVEGVGDPAPLTVRGLDIKNVIGLMNQVQAELPVNGRFEMGEDASRELVEVMRRSGDWDLEVNKIFKRAERVRGKIEGIKTAGERARAEALGSGKSEEEAEQAAAKASAEAEADATAFFENYAKKSFQETEFGTFAGFKAAVEEGRYLGVAEEIAIGNSEKRFAEGRKVDDQVQEMIDARVRARKIPPETAPYQGERPEKTSSVTDGERVLTVKREVMEEAEAAAAGATGPEAERLALAAESARLEFQIEKARRDVGTGLLERGVHYENLEKALEEGKDVATLFVDMGFLKYFDQMGGSDVGDTALKTAGAMMEQAVKLAGVKGSVYRYGGDEFTIQVEGGDEAARKVENALDEILDASEPIPAGAKSRSEYAPTKLAFNYGRADLKMMEDLHALAVREGKYSAVELGDPEFVTNKKAEMMTKAADVGIEYNKAYSRFILLIDEAREIEAMPDGEDKATRRMQFEAKKTFSGKAIFAEAGGKEKLEELSKSSLEGDALDEEIVDFVLEKVTEARAKESGKKEVLDALLAAQVKIEFLTDRLKEMEGVVGMQQHRILKLQEALRKAEEEKRLALEAKGDIDKAA